MISAPLSAISCLTKGSNTRSASLACGGCPLAATCPVCCGFRPHCDHAGACAHASVSMVMDKRRHKIAARQCFVLRTKANLLQIKLSAGRTKLVLLPGSRWDIQMLSKQNLLFQHSLAPVSRMGFQQSGFRGKRALEHSTALQRNTGKPRAQPGFRRIPARYHGETPGLQCLPGAIMSEPSASGIKKASLPSPDAVLD